MNTFSVLLAVLSVVTGICWIYDFFKKRPERIRRYKASIESAPALSKKERRKLLEPSGFIGQCASLFFIVLFVYKINWNIYAYDCKIQNINRQNIVETSKNYFCGNSCNVTYDNQKYKTQAHVLCCLRPYMFHN